LEALCVYCAACRRGLGEVNLRSKLGPYATRVYSGYAQGHSYKEGDVCIKIHSTTHEGEKRVDDDICVKMRKG
jgi:hypothetical protein